MSDVCKNKPKPKANKLCVNCDYYIIKSTSVCTHPKSLTSIDCVHGKDEYMSCRDMRDKDRACKVEGILYND